MADGDAVHYVDADSTCIPAVLMARWGFSETHRDLTVYFKKHSNVYRAVRHSVPNTVKHVFTWHRIAECPR